MSALPRPYRSRRALWVVVVLALLAVAGCTTTYERGRITEIGQATTVMADRLDVPWDIDFLPDGAALVTERDTGEIKKVAPGAAGRAATVTTVQRVQDSFAEGEGGLLGIAVSPRYASDGLVYVYYTTERDNRVATMRLGDEPRPILTGIPRSGVHNGGGLGFGPDGYLYASTGDGSEGARAQDKDSLSGKILRMTPDGAPAPGTPFGTLVYSYGHRNVQGFDWHADGRMYATEFGQNAVDELNRIEPGRNYGWPAVEGPGDDPAYTDPVVTWSPALASCPSQVRSAMPNCFAGTRARAGI